MMSELAKVRHMAKPSPAISHLASEEARRLAW